MAEMCQQHKTVFVCRKQVSSAFGRVAAPYSASCVERNQQWYGAGTPA
jgi:hypothetical protein